MILSVEFWWVGTAQDWYASGPVGAIPTHRVIARKLGNTSAHEIMRVLAAEPGVGLLVEDERGVTKDVAVVLINSIVDALHRHAVHCHVLNATDAAWTAWRRVIDGTLAGTEGVAGTTGVFERIRRRVAAAAKLKRGGKGKLVGRDLEDVFVDSLADFPARGRGGSTEHGGDYQNQRIFRRHGHICE